MIIYTHEDVLKMMNTFHTSELNRDLCMAKLTPIQLPQQETLYTEEQVRDAINLARAKTDKEYYAKPMLRYSPDEIIQSLKQPKIDIRPMTQEEMNEIRNPAYKYFDIDDTVNDTVNDVEKLAANLANPNADKTDNWKEGYLYAKETLYTEEDMLDAFYEGWEAKNLIWKEAKKQFKESLKEFKNLRKISYENKDQKRLRSGKRI
jgi:hypothetical protein